jgi:DNA processing protein
LDPNELAFWYWLSDVNGVGPVTFGHLLDIYGTPKGVFEGCDVHSTKNESASASLARAITATRGKLPKYKSLAQKQLELASKLDALILTLADSRYPEFLRRQVKCAPPILHCKGNLSLVRPQSVAIVGTRAPTEEARKRAEALGVKLSKMGHTVVAGMAKGIDTAAHRGSLDGGGNTIGVLGCGLDRTYPPENAVLYGLMADQALLVSEFPFGAAPTPENLRKRNKLIVALSEVVVVAECPANSGALIAARAALEQRRPLFVFSWSDWSQENRSGTKRLLEANLAKPFGEDGIPTLFEQGAIPTLTESVERVWEAVFPPLRQNKGASKKKRPDRKPSKKAIAQSGQAQFATSFKTGDRVQHPVHGGGKVVEVTINAQDVTIKVLFPGRALTLTMPESQARKQLRTVSQLR